MRGVAQMRLTTMKTDSIPAVIDTALRAHHASIIRLAEQLNRNPHELAADILRAGIKAVDGSLGELEDVEFPLHLETCDREFSTQAKARITETLDAASPEEMAALEEEGDGIPQVALWNRTVAEARRNRIVLA
jgi:hypothetical protein